MPWYRKEQTTPFDATAIEGLSFRDGDLLARLFQRDWTKGEKLPIVRFPSGEECQLWEGRDPGNPIVHLFGEFDLPYRDTRDRAYHQALSVAVQIGAAAYAVGERQLELWGSDGHLLVTYDDEAGHIADIEVIHPKTGERVEPPRPPLLDAESRAKLPPLNSQEPLGLDALAQVLFFTPDAGWTWWASEASALLDDDTYVALREIAADDPRVASIIFFGLVQGFELEFGPFTLEELEEIRGPLGLPVERDLYFEPTSFRELQRRQKGGR